MSEQPHVTNPEAIGDPDQTPILQHSVAECPAHSDDWLYAAVRQNRHNLELPPQACTCPEPTDEQAAVAAEGEAEHG